MTVMATWTFTWSAAPPSHRSRKSLRFIGTACFTTTMTAHSQTSPRKPESPGPATAWEWRWGATTKKAGPTKFFRKAQTTKYFTKKEMGRFPPGPRKEDFPERTCVGNKYGHPGARWSSTHTTAPL